MMMNDSRKPKRVALVQSAYVPWKGFFDLIGRCDEYIIYDTAAFTKNHWHNRNRIKVPSGTPWLTIPVATAGKLGQRIDLVTVSAGWAESHWSRIAQAYRTAPFFEQVAPEIRALYMKAKELPKLSDINEVFIRGLTTILKLEVKIVRDTAYEAAGTRTDRVVSLCRSSGATHYLSGPSAGAYLEPEKLAEDGIVLEWMQYGPYATYDQLHGPFDHFVSILDVMFMLGPANWRKSIVTSSEAVLEKSRLA